MSLAEWLAARFKLPRLLKPTREGYWYTFGFTVGVGIAAINTGNNLLYLVFGMLLGLIVASGILSEMSLRDLDVKRYVPSRIFAGRTFLMGIGLTNRKRKFPSFSIEVEDLLERTPLRKRCFFLKVPAGRAQQTSYRHQFARRGQYRLTGFRLSTKFPFALFRKWRDVVAPAEIIVFPALIPIRAEDLRDVGFVGDDPSNRRGRHGEFAGLRPSLQDDDARDIHWPATARTGRLMVREHEDEQQRLVMVVLDNARPPDAPRDSRDDESFERAVGIAASLCLHYAASGFTFGVAARGLVIQPALGDGQVSRCLRALALIDYADPEIPIASLPRLARRVLVSRQGVGSAA